MHIQFQNIRSAVNTSLHYFLPGSGAPRSSEANSSFVCSRLFFAGMTAGFNKDAVPLSLGLLTGCHVYRLACLQQKRLIAAEALTHLKLQSVHCRGALAAETGHICQPNRAGATDCVRKYLGPAIRQHRGEQHTFHAALRRTLDQRTRKSQKKDCVRIRAAQLQALLVHARDAVHNKQTTMLGRIDARPCTARHA